MARPRVRVRVPVFSKASLDLADLCARDLWRGRNYQTGKKQIPEQEVFLRYCIPFLAPALNLKDYQDYEDISVQMIEDFIKLAGLKQMNFRKGNKDVDKGIKNINMIVRKELKKALNDIYGRDFFDLATSLTDELSKDFHALSDSTNQKAFLPLASRLLFFMAPNVPIFMYSDELGKALKVDRNNKSVGIAEFFEAMSEGLQKNWMLLREYKMPFLGDSSICEDVWMEARNYGWWQRRVLDLACVIELTGGEARDFLEDLTIDYPREHP